VREDWFRGLGAELSALSEKDRLRSLRTYSGIDFGSNDYLGFATDDKLKEAMLEAARGVALSSSASRLLPGHHTEHLAAERYFANFIGAESALLFNSGYDANHALLTTLPTRHDLILYDERSHASIYDGVRASLAESQRFEHNSATELQNIILKQKDKFQARQLFIVLESLYSMDGDIASLREISDIANEFSAILIIDEAHATGVFGKQGDGLVNHTIGRSESIITMHTCSKALGSTGAFVAASKIVTDYLINKARAFIFTTALPPLIPQQIINSIKRLETDGDSLVARLRERSGFVRNELHKSLTRWSVPDGISSIIPIIIGADGVALQASRSLETLGFIVPAVRPPSVPEGSSRLRLNVSLRHSEDELRRVIDAIVKVETESAA
jgi:8-amino-7-oxononanoate synthase